MTSNPTFNLDTSALEVARTYSAQATGKIALITGVSPNSLGHAIAAAFAHGGASTIITTGRNQKSLAKATQSLSSAYPSTTFRPLNIRLDSLRSVHTAAQELLADEKIPCIDILIACAGVHDLQTQRSETDDGIEWHFGVNHLAHYALITFLLPKLRATATGKARIVTLTSGLYVVSPFRVSDWNFNNEWTGPLPKDERPDFSIIRGILEYTDTEGYEHSVAYAQSKTCAVLTAVAVNSLYEGIEALCVDPGFVGTPATASLWASFDEEKRGHLPELKTPDQGAATVVVAALDPGLQPEKGVLLKGCQVVGEGVPEWAVSRGKANELWEVSKSVVEKALGL